jgi:hypothetical protein
MSDVHRAAYGLTRDRARVRRENDSLKGVKRVPFVEQRDRTTLIAKRPTYTGPSNVVDIAVVEHHTLHRV